MRQHKNLNVFFVASCALWGQPQTAQKTRAYRLNPQMYLKKKIVHLRMQLNSCTWVPALNMGNSWNFWRKMTQIQPYPNISHMERKYFSGRTLHKQQVCISRMQFWRLLNNCCLEKHLFPLKNTDRCSFIKYRALSFLQFSLCFV